MHHHDHGARADDPASSETAARTRSHRRRLAIACAITVGVVLAQAIGAWVTGSLALLTDAVHSLTDSIGLGVALVAAGLMHRAATSQRTWGFRRVEILAGLLQATLLLGVGIYAAVEGIGRLSAPPAILHIELLIFGAVGLTGNVISLLVLASGRKANFNMRAAFLEVTADALGSLAVMVAAVVIWTTGWQQADAVAALAIAALIIPRALLLLRETARVLLEFAPRGLDLEQVRAHMLAQDHVQEVHDLHASTVATGLPVISAHVVLDDACFREGCVPETLSRLKTCVAEHFDVAVEHSTFQLEPRSIAAGETHTHA
ncbi:cation diffusion facilitator family transporter [Nesterenkonia sp. LB17]|uniref:cation diffusion facilitator family transporter n=1 Tax=unclassified Nesterenkonia TaxID=2629769 RepID=UPI001F4C69D8|nr:MULTISPECIES: cation diffusion facilitator family transporter [unclassified Nesterenkonia]MCH8559789.1 cation diffusion facilitator family transporter [Nesterenkonia sp. DZ6]MCH8564510.1 cation diffusion facilitator family transporter [Nesterenkonia sp. LB17]MCH8570136.1 cation diffusion facilitator family transporter [Nesterenkonia sp. AY15]